MSRAAARAKMMSVFLRPALRAAALLALAAGASHATEFSVAPIRVELKPGALSETLTVTNHAQERLRVTVKLMEWSQDAEGKDVYQDSGDLVYFPRQIDMEGEGKRLVRVGAKAPAGVTERTYRIFIEEQPQPMAGDPTQVSFYFRFGVPVFLPPVAPRLEAEVDEPQLQQGKISIAVRNTGNRHFRLHRIRISNDRGHAQEIAGWYTLAGARRTYQAELPPEVCRAGGTFDVVLEGEDIRFERKLHVDPAACQ